MSSPNLDLKLLGPISYTLDGQPVKRLSSRTVEAVLVYVLLQPVPVARERLVAMFFSGSEAKQAKANLRSVLTELRRRVGRFLVITDTTVGRQDGCVIAIDALEFSKQSTLRQAQGAAENRKQITVNELAAALDLYRGDFLTGFYVRDAPQFEHWALLEQERLRLLVLDGLQLLLTLQQTAGRFRDALLSAEKLLTIEPLDDDIHHAKMLLLARTGNRIAALQHFAEAEKLYAAELDVPLSQALHDLRQRIAKLPDRTVHKLPPQPSQFIGRARELEQLYELIALPQTRLLTLLGIGGMGKTRLAQQLGYELIKQRQGLFLDGVYFVDLVAVDSAENLVQSIATVLDLKFQGQQPLQQQLFTFLDEQELLLILDNFEQLSDQPTALAFVSKLLQSAPACKLVATSRKHLALACEQIFSLDGLTHAESADQSDAVALFLAAAQRQRHGYAPTAAERDTIATICRLLDGIPLAIELAAAGSRHQTISDIHAAVEHSYDVLTTRQRNMPQRQRSLRAVFDYSWGLLSADLQQLLAKLSIFPAAFSYKAAAAVCGASDAQLALLSQRSLLVQLEDQRLRLFAPVRDYASAALPAGNAMAAHHAAWYTATLQKMADSPLSKVQFDEIRREMANLEAAWQWWLAQADVVQLRVLMQPLFEFFNWASLWHRGIELFGRTREQLADRFPIMDALLAARMGRFYISINQFGLAIETIAVVLVVLENSAELTEAASAYAIQARAIALMGDYQPAIKTAERGMAVALRAEHDESVIRNHTVLGTAHKALGNYQSANRHMQAALRLNREIDDALGIGIALNNLGNLMVDSDDAAAASDYLMQAASLFHDLEFEHGEATALSNASIAEGKRSNHVEAERLQRQALQIKRRLGNQRSVVLSLAMLADSLVKQAKPDESLPILQEGLALAIAVNTPDALEEIFISSAEYLMVKNRSQVASQVASHLANSTTLREATKERLERLQQSLPASESQDTNAIIALLQAVFNR